jgi:hypothetical protein
MNVGELEAGQLQENPPDHNEILGWFTYPRLPAP